MTTIAFVVISEGLVKQVCEDPQLAQLVAQNYPNSIIDPWILDNRTVEDATVSDWLDGRKILPKLEYKVGDDVYFNDDYYRGVGKIKNFNYSGIFEIQPENCEVYYKISKRMIIIQENILMYPEDVMGVVE